jgi:hypothetical protein
MTSPKPDQTPVSSAKRLPLISLGILLFLLAMVLQAAVGMVSGIEKIIGTARETIYFGGALIAIGVFLFGCVDKWLLHPRRDAYRIPGYRWMLGLLVVAFFGIPLISLVQDKKMRAQADRDAGQVSEMLKEEQTLGASLQARYMEELNGIGWPTLLDFPRLKKDKANGLADSKSMLEKAVAISRKYEAEAFAITEKARDRIKALDISDDAKDKMLESQTAAAEGVRETVEQIWALEKTVFQQFVEIVALLDRTDAWDVQGTQVVFQNNEDLEKFNGLVQTLQKAVQEQQQLQAAEAAKTQDAVDALTPAPGT